MPELLEILADRPPAPSPPPPTRPGRADKRHLLLNALLALSDALLILAGFALAYAMRYSLRWPAPLDLVVREVAAANQVPIEAFLPFALLLVALLLALFGMKGLYRMPRAASLLDYAGIIISSTTTGIAVLIVVVFLYQSSEFYSRLIFAFAWAAIALLLVSWRGVLIGVRRWRWSRGIGRERVLVVGGTGLGRYVMEGVVAHPFLGYALVGYLDDDEPPPSVRPNLHFRHVGPISALERLARSHEVDRVILALPFWEHHRLPELVEVCRAAGVEFQVAPDLYSLSFDRVDVDQLSGIPLIGLKEVSLKGWNLLLKRVLDLTLVLLAAPFALVLGGLIALAIRLDSPGPAVFKQTRVGKHGKLFTAYKFRTMVADAETRKAEVLAGAGGDAIDERLFKVRDDPRRTRVGRLLRRTSLDELPQFWNVLRGEMSLVGPRPQVPEEVAQYEPWHCRRLEVTPGLTGLWQVLGRSETSFDEMVRLDIYYAENWSLDMDVRILLLTLPAVISGRGAY